MATKTRFHHLMRAGFWLFLLALIACAAQVDEALAPPVTLDGAWQALAQGLDYRVLTPNGDMLAQMAVVRIDPNDYTFRVHYRPNEPLLLREWQALLPAAVIIANANFFDPQHQALGLVVSDGAAYGSSYQGRGGTFALQNGLPFVRSNRLYPYRGEALEQAIQAFPMLVENGAAVASNSLDRSRRTIIAQDQAGRILLMATPLLGLSFADLGAYLTQSDLGISNALNLDGGGSTLLFIQPSDYRLNSFDAVPTVLAVYPRITP